MSKNNILFVLFCIHVVKISVYCNYKRSGLLQIFSSTETGHLVLSIIFTHIFVEWEIASFVCVRKVENIKTLCHGNWCFQTFYFSNLNILNILLLNETLSVNKY